MDGRHPRRWLILVVLCLSTAVLVIAGGLSDRYGRRKVLIIGLALFGLSSLAATFAADPAQLIVARAVMGVGGALIMPSTLSILITVFDEDERRKAMSAWSAVAMAGLIGGPVLGGVLIAWFSWGAVFLINVPIAIGAVIAAVTLMPESKGPKTKADPVGATLSVTGMTALVWTIIELPAHGLARPSALVAVVALAGFVFWELRTPSPMVPLGLFRNQNFSGAGVSLTPVQIANGGLLLVLTQYLQFVLGYTPTQAGLAFLPMALASLTCNALGATLGARIGNRALAAGGLIAAAVAFTVMRPRLAPRATTAPVLVSH